MEKTAIVVLSDTGTDDGLGRIVNAMAAAKEFREAGDELKIVFSGAGTKWIGELVKAEHPAHPLFMAVRSCIEGACGYCASAFKQKETVEEAGIRILADFGPNMSYRKLTQEGYRVLTF